MLETRENCLLPILNYPDSERYRLASWTKEQMGSKGPHSGFGILDVENIDRQARNDKAISIDRRKGLFTDVSLMSKRLAQQSNSKQ